MLYSMADSVIQLNWNRHLTLFSGGYVFYPIMVRNFELHWHRVRTGLAFSLNFALDCNVMQNYYFKCSTM